MESLSHPLETRRKAFNEACAQLKMNPPVNESSPNQIAPEPKLAETSHGFTEPSAYLQVREKPPQMKLEQQIECAKGWADELRHISSRRQLSAFEIEKLKAAELLANDLKKQLFDTKNGTDRSKKQNDNSAEDLRSSSSTPSIEILPSFAKSSSPSRKRPHSPLPKTNQKNNFASPQPSSFFCQICKKFPSAAHRLSHMIEHFIASFSIISCQQCSKQFKARADFQQHFLYNHSEILQRCNICCHVFTQISTFQDHLATHMTSETRYTCVACPNSIFENLGSFKSHIQLFHDKNESSNGSLKASLIEVSNNNYATTIAPGPSFKA